MFQLCVYDRATDGRTDGWTYRFGRIIVALNAMHPR